MDYENTVWEQIYQHLEAEGFEVYSPSTKIGVCERPYLVVTIDTGNAHPVYSTNIDLYTILCYVPLNQYSKLERLVLNVRKSMAKLKPLVKSNGFMTPSFADDVIKAHMVSLQFVNYKKRL